MKKKGMILISAGLLMLLLAPTFFRGVDCLHRVLDAEGHPVLREGRPVYERARWAEVKKNWDAYAIGSIGGIMVIGGIVILVSGRSKRAREA